AVNSHRYLPCDEINEDTFAHSALDVLVWEIFPVSNPSKVQVIVGQPPNRWFPPAKSRVKPTQAKPKTQAFSGQAYQKLEFLRETGVILFEELHLLASCRIEEVRQEDFVDSARLFAVYSGGPGNGLGKSKEFAHLLHVRAAMAETIQHYQYCLTTTEKDDFGGESDKNDPSWLYQDPESPGEDQTLGNSPLRPLQRIQTN
ncbi:hypothetical protein BGZ46_003394, partial [Entomortierella lignicola]